MMKEDTDYEDAEIEDIVPATLGALKSPTEPPPAASTSRAGRTFGQWMLDDELLKAGIDPSVVATNECLPDGCA